MGVKSIQLREQATSVEEEGPLVRPSRPASLASK